MSYEVGGRADKSGNRYEIRWVVYQLLKVIEEKIVSVTLEALGEDEVGVDVWIRYSDGIREAQQCKGRNGSKDAWTISTARSKDIFKKWKFQLDRGSSNCVSLVSPVSFVLLEGLSERARNTSQNPSDFYEGQILNSGQDVIKFYKSYCVEMGLDIRDECDIRKSIDYLRRTTYRQTADTVQKENVLDKIHYLFIGNEVDIYESFVNLVIEGEILGKEITCIFLHDFLKEKKIKMRSLANDTRIIPHIKELNREYKEFFVAIGDGLINRKEFILCEKVLEQGKSLIIHGRAGIGKSGCTEGIINFCESRSIPYIAIKLDKRVPIGNAEKWGETLGFSTSLVHCIHSISAEKNAVIILDQLDALRWTLAHSRDSLLVCSEIIDQVVKVNIDRKYKLSIVFICRTYDLENDNNIRSLFTIPNDKEEAIQWEKIKVSELDDEIVMKVVGQNYNNLSKKMKSVLSIPSNLYIWKHLNKNTAYDEFSTANHLIEKWWDQLLENCSLSDINECDVREVIDKLVITLEQYGKISISNKILNANKGGLRYLTSNGFLLTNENIVSFSHQSILDYFLADKMLRRCLSDENIVDIIGSKGDQTPAKRYQVQLLFQNLAEFDEGLFISKGKEMLYAPEIRFYIKFVFFEVLSQLESINENIVQFIMDYYDSDEYGSHIINNVVYAHPIYVRLFRDENILRNWMIEDGNKDRAINLLVSISPFFEDKDIHFLKQYLFQSEEVDEKLYRCFSYDINLDTDAMFELRMEYYNHYPNKANQYINFKEMIKNCEMRTIRIIDFWLKHEVKNKGDQIYRYEEELLEWDSDFILDNNEQIVDILLPNIPQEDEATVYYSDWSGRHKVSQGIKRACVEIIKKANIAIIKQSPEQFISKYSNYMGKGYAIYNEIILSGLRHMPLNFSDMVMEYLFSDIDMNIFDRTSGSNNELLLAKEIVDRFAKQCGDEIFSKFEKIVSMYIDPRAKEYYKRRIDFNRNNKEYHVFWSFWGDLQFELLSCMPLERLSPEASGLLKVLKRKFSKGTFKYNQSGGHGGWVKSPISGKELGNKKLVELMTNQRIKDRGFTNSKEVPGGFIESSVFTFSSHLSGLASSEPIRMINLLFSCRKKTIIESYIDSIFSGVAFGEKIKEVPIELLEEMVIRFPYDYESQRARYICNFVQKRSEEKWSQNILDMLKDVALNHKNPELGKPIVTNNKDKEIESYDMLQSNALNCVRGEAISAIASLIWGDYTIYNEFKSVIEILLSDVNPVIKFACLQVLWPVYNIDRAWASARILELYEDDYRLAGFHGSKNMFFLLYPNYRERVIKVIQKCYYSEDEELMEVGGYSLAEMFIVNNEFAYEMNCIEEMSEKQAEAIMHMAVIYLNIEKYNQKAKEIILSFRSCSLNLESSLSRIFYDEVLDLDRDKDFLIEIMQSEISRRTIHAFVHYLETDSKSILDYRDIILVMIHRLLNDLDSRSSDIWVVENELSKLVIGLYDEAFSLKSQEMITLMDECLDLWDKMYEKQIGMIRNLSRQMMDM